MALIIADRVKQKSTTTGTGNISFSASVDGFQTFANVCSASDTCYYTIQEESGTDFEIGHGTFNGSGQLERTNVLQSSNSDSAVNFGAGTKEVFITYPADKAVFQNYDGSITIPSTIDGRDLATDGSKLDGIEASATADQTAAEIRTLVESATDSNVFTDADHTKLNGIEASATADQTGAEIKSAYEGEADTNAFTDALLTKLNGIAASAEVNVQSDWNSSSGDSQILNKPTIPSAVGGASGVDFNDDVKARFGTGNDLEIYHDASHSYIAEVGTGDLNISSSDTIHFNNAAGVAMAKFWSAGAAELYHNGTKKLETTASGATVTGTLAATTLDGLLDTGAALKVGAWYNDNGSSAKGRFYFTDGGTTQINTAGDIDFSYEVTNKARIESDGDFICVGNVTAYGSLSDEKLKENIEIIPNALDKVSQLKGVTFDYKKDGKRSTGLIAQDLQKVLPEVVYETKDINNENESYLAVNYENTIGLLVEAIKDLKNELDNHKKKCKCDDFTK